MGCCFSRSSGPNSPYPGGAPNGSSRAINQQPLSLPEPAQPSSQHPASSRRRRHHHPHHQRPLDQHIDKPLRRHQWSSRDHVWTASAIAQERADFFDTRVTGRAEVWQAIHAALKVLWDPEAQDVDDGSNGLATAQMILSAADISLPTGNLVNGVYDSLGNYYQLPEWVVADPQNLHQDDAPEDGLKPAFDMSNAAANDTTADEDDEDGDAGIASGQKIEKGKDVISSRETISVRARLSENGLDVAVTAGKSDPVKAIAKKVAQQADLPTTKRIRLAYMGKILKDNRSLNAQGWQTGHVVNALVFNQP